MLCVHHKRVLSQGVSCRFAKAHTDDKGRNIKKDDYDEDSSQTTFNGISSGGL